MSSRSTNRANSKGSSARLVSQTPIDAKLHAEFEKSEQHFDYTSSVDVNASTSTSNIPSSTVSAYLQKIQRGGLVQSFGCMLAVDERDFIVLAYSENAPEMLDLAPHSVPSMEQQEALTIGTDVRTLFRPSCAAALQKAANFPEVNLLNPLLVHCKTSGKPFYAILHRIDVGLVIDLEPVNPADVPVTAAGALKSYKLASKAISKLQSLPGGNISLLCDALVREVMELVGYDRVMVYKFHEDEHGEVVAECRRPDLEPYLGLHYPATDIPQASRFLFMKNKVRMICDCLSLPVKVIQDSRLLQPLSLGGSTLRAPHGCHAQYMANMGSIASLAMSITINEDDDSGKSDQPRSRKLWGLIVCHHTSPRFVPFPLRYACEFLVQVFGVQISKEVALASQMKEKHMLQIQTVLCDMLLRDSLIGIVTQSPNVMDLVKCDGAALCFKGKVWSLGVCPTEEQIKDISHWLLKYHGSSTGLSSDSLMEAGYPGASRVGGAVCGMAVIRITSNDFLYWFRSPTAKETKWGGAKHDPVDRDDGRKMQPRSSFKAFLEVVKWRSIPWEDMEMDAIHSLQLILRGWVQDNTEDSLSAVVNDSKMIVEVPAVDATSQKLVDLRTVTSEMVRLIETAGVPIFAVDSCGNINGWNIKVAELTGLSLEQATGLPLISVIMEETTDAVKVILSRALQGKEEKNIELRLKTFGSQEKIGPILIVANACCSRDTDDNVVGICFIGQDITTQKAIMDKYTQIQGDYVGIMRNPSPLIPPIFLMDENGLCLEWNYAMQRISGLNREDAIGRILLGEVFSLNEFGCQVRDADTLTRLRILMNQILGGETADKLLFGFFNQQGECIEALLSASPRMTSDGNISGVLCFLYMASPELQYALQMQKASEHAATDSLKKLSYFRMQMRNALNGMSFTRKLIESSGLSKQQNQILRTKSLCEDQLAQIVNDNDISSIEDCYAELNSGEFHIEEALDAVMAQVRNISQGHNAQVILDSPSDISSMCLYGDHLRLQQVLSDFLATALCFTPVMEGSSVTLAAMPRREHLGTKMQVVHLEFRITHPAPGVPENLIQEMFHQKPGMSREGLGLYISQKLVRIMNGTVQYIRGEERYRNVQFCHDGYKCRGLWRDIGADGYYGPQAWFLIS